MAGKNAIEILLKLKDQATKKLGKATSGLKNKFSKLGTAIKVGAVAALGLFAVALRKCITAAADQEVIFAKLQQAVENMGMEWGKAEKQIKNFAAALQKTTIYGDTETAKLLQDLIPYTNDLSKAMTGAEVAMDMAAAGLFDINTAGKYVGMAMQGNVEMLGRYIGELRSSTNAQLKNMTATEKTAYALDLLEEKYGGMAKKELTTFNGQLKQVKNYFGDIAEAIGDKFLPALTTAGKAWAKWLGAKPVREVSDEMNQLVNRLNEVTTSLGDMTKHRSKYHKVDELIIVTERERIALVGQIQRLLVKETEEKEKQLEIDVLSEKQATLRETLQVRILKLRGKEKEAQLMLLEIEVAKMKIASAGKEEIIKQIELYHELAKAKIESEATEARKRELAELRINLEEEERVWTDTYGDGGTVPTIIKDFGGKMVGEIKARTQQAKKAIAEVTSSLGSSDFAGIRIVSEAPTTLEEARKRLQEISFAPQPLSMAGAISRQSSMSIARRNVEILERKERTTNININIPNAVVADGRVLKNGARVLAEEIERQRRRGQIA